MVVNDVTATHVYVGFTHIPHTHRSQGLSSLYWETLRHALQVDKLHESMCDDNSHVGRKFWATFFYETFTNVMLKLTHVLALFNFFIGTFVTPVVQNVNSRRARPHKRKPKYATPKPLFTTKQKGPRPIFRFAKGKRRIKY